MALTKVTGQVIKNTTDVTVGVLTVTNTLAVGGTVSIGGTLTYEDVTNVDAVGLITARNGIVVGSGITLSKDGDVFATGVTTTGSLVSSGAISGTTGTFSGAVSGTTGTFTGDVDIADKIVHTGDTNTALRFPAADQIQLETAGSVRTHIHSDGRFRVGCTAQPSGTVSGFQLDMGSYPGTLRLMSGAGASATGESAGISVGGSNHNADITNGNNYGANLNLYNYNSTDGNSTAVSFFNSNGLSASRIVGNNASHSSRTGNLVFMTASGSSPTEKLRIDSSGRLLLGTTTEGEANADDLTIAGSGHVGITIRAGTTSQSAIYMSDATSGGGEYAGNIIYDHNDNHMRFATAETERFRITSDGHFGIGDTTPAEILTIRDATPRIRLEDSDTTNAACQFVGDNASVLIQADTAGVVADSTISFAIDGGERLRINSSGNVKIGATANRDLGGLSAQRLHIEGTDGAGSGLSLVNNQNSTGFPSIRFAKSRGTSVGSNTVVQNNDPLGGIIFCGADGNDMVSVAAEILCEVGGTPGSNDMPGELIFKTTADDASSASQRMKIFANGAISVGTDDNSRSFTLFNPVSNDTILRIQNDVNNEDTGLEIVYQGSSAARTFRMGGRIQTSNDDVQFAATEGFRFYPSSGSGTHQVLSLQVASAAIGSFSTSGSSLGFNFDLANGHGQQISTNNTGFRYHMRFYNPNGQVGYISTQNSTTNYNTSGSDRTLKENFEDWNEDVLSLFKNINPQKFNFIADDEGAEKTKGFVAQDMVSSFPEAYTKGFEEDAKYMFNPSGMVVYLMKALKESVTEIESLKARLNAAGL